MRALHGLLLVTLFLGTFGALGSRTASAYPQWQFSSGTSRCSQCHFSPAGGGIVTGYARDAVGEELSTWTGDGGFLHGKVKLPKALALQFDGRAAALGHDAGNASGPTRAVFPMQADLALRVSLADGFSFLGVAGYRGQARASDSPVGPGAAKPIPGSAFASREHYFMYRPAATGWYVRGGRFFAPYGLRLAEHYAYVRTDTGFGQLEETYNVSGGVVQSEWEVHVTAFAPDFLRKMGGRDKGLAGLYERRIGEASAVGLSARLSLGEGVNRAGGGVFWKTFFEKAKSQIQAEANVFNSTYVGKHTDKSFSGYLGVTVFPVRGLWVTPFAERSQTDLSVKGTATNAGGLQMSWFPYPHFEIVWLGRAQMPTGQGTTKTGMLFVHYYL